MNRNALLLYIRDLRDLELAKKKMKACIVMRNIKLISI